MTSPINDFQDILNAIERDPPLRDALRRHILTAQLNQATRTDHTWTSRGGPGGRRSS